LIGRCARLFSARAPDKSATIARDEKERSIMRFKLLGRSGLRVSELALGAMTFGEDWGWGASKEESRKMFDAYVEAGGNFIDTANRYTEGTSEQFVGDFIASDRARFVLATKYTLQMRRDDPSFSGNNRKNLVQSLEASLTRLRTDYIDLYWLHAWDFTTEVDEVMRALDDIVRSGKVLYVGISDTPAWIVSRANTLADLRGWTPFVGIQIRYSLIDRTAEADLLPMARALDLGATAWSVLGAGVLTGKYSRGKEPGVGRAKEGAAKVERNLGIAREVVAVAGEMGCTPSQVAISWVRSRPGVVIPILGGRNLFQIKENLRALDVTLGGGHLKRLDEASRVDLGFPHNFLHSDAIRDIVFGGTYDRIDNHRRDRSGHPL
jgi:aryl-alcohol dehydrogenase-like predicted oxidoreductase